MWTGARRLAGVSGLALRRGLSTAHAAQGAPVSVFFGSQTGTAQAFAEEFASEGDEHGLECKVVDLRKFQPTQLVPGTKAVILAACYGMGEPTDNAREFYEWLLSADRKPDSMKGIDYTVFGLGSKRTHPERFCVVGVKIDKRMEELGANRIFERVDGDDSDAIEFQFEDWKSGVLTTLEKGKAEAPAPAPVPAASVAEPPKDTKPKTNTYFKAAARAAAATPSDFFKQYTQNTFCHSSTAMMRILENKELSPRSDRSTKEMRIVADRGAYETGDHLVVYPTNRAENVEKLLSRLNTSSLSSTWRSSGYTVHQVNDKKIGPPLNHTPVSLEDMFAHTVDVQSSPSPRTLKVLAEYCGNPAEKEAILSVLSPAAYKEQITGRQITLANLLKMYPSLNVPVELAVELLPQLQPRYYSISSSPNMHPDEVHVTYRVVEYKNAFTQEHRHGVCSTWLAQLGVGEAIPAYFWKSTYKLPTDPSTPVILIAGGTGIAPFKGFLEERQVSKVKCEPMDLFYGVRDNKEFVYEDMLKKAKADGHFGHFGVCYSSEPGPDNKKPLFLDAYLRGYAEILWNRLERGGYVYVCGGAGGFGPSIVSVFKTSVLQQVGGLSPAAADAYFSNLLASGRYLEDLSD